jgi:4-hydroxyphenylpyruvate dioxygenase
MNSPRLVTANTRTFSASLAHVADAVKAAGFNGLELWKEDVARLPGGAAEVRTVLASTELRVSALQLLRDFEGSGPERVAERLAEAERLMSLMPLIGADTLLVCSNANPHSSSDRLEQAADLRALAELAAARHLRIGFEPLAWSPWINNYETAWDCVASIDHPALGLTLDMFHLFARETPISFLERVPIEKYFGVQLCNAVPMPLPLMEIARHHRRLPSSGAWPVADVIRRLEARGYAGFYTVEVFNDAYLARDVFELARAAWDSYRALFAVEQSTS